MNNKPNDNIDYRRKRVNMLKKLIVFIIIALLILPTMLCVYLGIQVNQLQKEVDELNATYGVGETYGNTNEDSYAYAAVKTDVTKESASDTYNENNEDDENIPEDLDSEDKKTTDDKNKTTTDKDHNKSKEISKEDNSKKGIYKGIKVYLTFDDGPSIYTAQILDTLAEYNIKATFFVIGKTDKTSKKLYQRIVDEGHTLGMHSYSHKYDKIYKSVEDFDKDFTKLWKLLYDTTGYKPNIYRFPGGSDNLVNPNGMDDFIKYLNEKNIVYYDWNVLNGDATNKVYSEQQLVDNILNGVKGKKRAIVLLHDTQSKKSTADSLPQLLEALISGEAELLPLDNTVEPIQMIKADTVK